MKEPIEESTLCKLESIKAHYTQTRGIDEIWEELSSYPINSLYNIHKTSNISVILLLISQFVESICSMVLHDLYYDNTPRKDYTSFIHTYTAFTLDKSNNPRYITINKFNLKDANLQRNKSKRKKLTLQLLIIPQVIHTILLVKNKKQSQKTVVACSSSCKLLGFTPRYVSLDIQDKLHNIYCLSLDKLSSLYNLPIIVPDVTDTINTAIQYVTSIQ